MSPVHVAIFSAFHGIKHRGLRVPTFRLFYSSLNPKVVILDLYSVCILHIVRCVSHHYKS